MQLTELQAKLPLNDLVRLSLESLGQCEDVISEMAGIHSIDTAILLRRVKSLRTELIAVAE